MRTLILYKTKFGASKQYAEWIKEESKDADVFDVDSFDFKEISGYEFLVLVSRTYMGKIQMIGKITKELESLKDKKIYLVVVGMVPQDKEASKQAYEMIPAYIREKLVGYKKLFGKLTEDTKLNIFEKILLKLMKTKFSDKVKKENLDEVLREITQFNC